jgi:hypothetical protein
VSPFLVTPSVSFVGVAPSLAVRDYVVDTICPLLGDDVIACRVALEMREHARTICRFRSRIELDVPRGTIVVGSTGEAFADIRAAIDDSARDLKHLLAERAVRARRFSKAG